MLKRCFKVQGHPKCTSIGLLLVRLVMGAAFLFHGWSKIQNPMGWMPPESPVPGIFQALAALSEFGGGFALILGLLIPLASLGLACTMFVATCMHAFVLKDPFVATGPGTGAYEPALIFLSLSLLFLLAGPGKFSLDAKIFGTK